MRRRERNCLSPFVALARMSADKCSCIGWLWRIHFDAAQREAAGCGWLCAESFYYPALALSASASCRCGGLLPSFLPSHPRHVIKPRSSLHLASAALPYYAAYSCPSSIIFLLFRFNRPYVFYLCLLPTIVFLSSIRFEFFNFAFFLRGSKAGRRFFRVNCHYYQLLSYL